MPSHAPRFAAALIVLSMLAISSPTTAEDTRPAIKGAGLAPQWLDKRLPGDERYVLAATEGFAPPAIQSDTKWCGEELKLEERGKVTLIQSWTHKTESGRSAVQRIPALLKNVPAEDLRIVYLHTPEGADDAASFLEKRPAGSPVLVDTTGRFCDDLGVYKRPVTILVDRQGAIRCAGVSIVSLPDAVTALLAEKYDEAKAKPEVVKSRDERDGLSAPAEEKPADAEKEVEHEPAKNAKFPPVNGSVNANDLRGKKGPTLQVGQWMTKKPETEGKVVMMEFWATWCGPCIAGIPHLNELHDEFKDRVVIVGISDEPPGTISSMMKQKSFKYSVASDQQRRAIGMVRPQGIPHAIVMSPDGIVRWQGHPARLDSKILGQIVDASGVTAKASGGNAPATKRWRLPGSTPKAS